MKKIHKKLLLSILISCLLVTLVIVLRSFWYEPEVSITKRPAPVTVPVTPMVHTPEQFGANGFDTKPDTTALQKALNAGGIVQLQNHATYIIDRPLVSKQSIVIETKDYAQAPATILQQSKETAFIFDNKPIASTTVAKNVAYNKPYVVVKDATGMKEGDLLHLRSTKLWYWDNRGYLTKGELHKITKIEGNTIYLDRTTQERYKVDLTETVTATAYPNAKLQIRNVSFAHPNPYNTVMMKVSYTSNAHFDKLSITNSQRVGLLLNATFQSVVSQANVNLGTTKDITSGYGIQDYGGSETLITDSTFMRVRRGVDFSGDTPSRYGTVRHSKAYGYKDGVLASGNSGFGTHSTAEHITFENNYVENFSYGFVTRGTYITIKNNIHTGFSRSFVATSYGNHVNLLHNTYKSRYNSSLENFVVLLDSYRGDMIAAGNTVENIKGPFIKGNAAQLDKTTIMDNNINTR
ncbi:hypothetical protein P6P90_13205 [Ectobacillus antri]|jgi:hypothetical protein|uniref:Right-handed parallel beta-helix repeat-containing protein n=1 Tax=Ectobacillus antri TaxID=2486280 RepID=A0ABT6H8E9_9BACI|nr:hypothetical protein [Ectobacillus antri]MDG4658137.1 hypothetical protein [Ectobacillus antri]MDG5754917.1 hypothetical protein [Ectobacillus antri]